ncbi:aldo/keto reductase [Frankia sp. AvcI1]|uniref:aldo/keto reductase n=2 Tax=Frankia sp. AvcI1 TaxID=573496 RepID=UPI002117E241|nr:aldo/keto reductase [Frankia sp. AvcI1]
MDYRTMGRSGLKVSQACLGAMNFGSVGLASCDETEATRIINAFLDAGHNVIDTADIYSGGQSEQIVGRAISARRDEVVLATKGHMPAGPGPNGRGSSRVHLTRALDASLSRLGTDYVDLYQVHQPDDETPIEETMATLDGFVRAGKVRYLGCSNYNASRIVEAQWAAERIHGTPFVSLQPQYSLVARGIEAEVLPVCARHGMGTLIYSPLAGGILAGRYRRDGDPDADTRVARLRAWGAPAARRFADGIVTDRGLDIAEAVAGVAAELDTTSAAVALAWAAARPGVTSVIIGPRTFDQYEQSLAGFEITLPAQHVARLDEISGPAPGPLDGRIVDH